MVNYIVAIPSYNRTTELTNKTLHTLKESDIPKNKIYIFVANKEQYKLYTENVPKNLYGHIIIGKKGIANQRTFIAQYFPEGQYVISMDDDVEQFEVLKNEKLVKLTNIQQLFIEAYHLMKKEKLFLWGIYPVRNPYFMYKKITTDLRFIIGVTFGFIVRHNPTLKVSIKAETKEDYEQSILYYLKDGGVIRFNNITVKTKFNAPGGLGTDRYDKNKNATKYLIHTYPDLVFYKERKNGMPEVRLALAKRIIN